MSEIIIQKTRDCSFRIYSYGKLYLIKEPVDSVWTKTASPAEAGKNVGVGLPSYEFG